MSTALDFTVDIGSLPTRDQGPLKAKNGMFVNKPQERRFQIPERVKSDQMLAEAPPISLNNRFQDLLYRQTEGEPEEFTKENPVFRFDQNQIPQTVEPPRPQMDPQLQQILLAQNDMSGIMSTPLSGLQLLMARETFDI